MRHTAEARKLLRGLDAELAATARRLGRAVEWTERDRAILELIAGLVDRKTDLSAAYAHIDADDTKTRVKISAELRLLETALARLLRQVETEPPHMSHRSRQAQRAALARWDRRGA
jgi:hypothetical protein